MTTRIEVNATDKPVQTTMGRMKMNELYTGYTTYEGKDFKLYLMRFNKHTVIALNAPEDFGSVWSNASAGTMTVTPAAIGDSVTFTKEA